MPGRVDSATQRLRFAPNLGWRDFDIKGAIEKGTGMAVVPGWTTPPNTCLLAGRYRLAEWTACAPNAVLVTISEGVGSGILSNGQLIYGEHGMAGEFGHIPLDAPGTVVRVRGARLLGRSVCHSSTAALRYYAESKPKVAARTS